jgi:hypothetical protein
MTDMPDGRGTPEYDAQPPLILEMFRTQIEELRDENERLRQALESAERNGSGDDTAEQLRDAVEDTIERRFTERQNDA